MKMPQYKPVIDLQTIRNQIAS